MIEHPLKGKWILHYFDGGEPWRSISDLPEDEALAINAKTGKKSGVCSVTGKEKYYQDRLQVEAWDRTQHINRGGCVDSLNPVYAILSDVEIPEKPYRPGNCIAIPAEHIPVEFLSLTFGDSFPNYFLSRERDKTMASPHLWGRSYSPKDLIDVLADRPLCQDWLPEKYSGKNSFYVEVRIYTRNLPTSQDFERPNALRPQEQILGNFGYARPKLEQRHHS